MKGAATRLQKLEKHAHADDEAPVTIRLEVIVDDGKGNLTKDGKPYTPGPGVIVLRPGRIRRMNLTF